MHLDSCTLAIWLFTPGLLISHIERQSHFREEVVGDEWLKLTQGVNSKSDDLHYILQQVNCHIGFFNPGANNIWVAVSAVLSYIHPFVNSHTG